MAGLPALYNLREKSRCQFLRSRERGGLLLAGCTSVSVQREVGALEQLPPPSRVLVYNFAVTPQEVQLDSVGAAITRTLDGTADSQQEQQVGHAVANALAKRLVSDIQNMGLYAERAWGPGSADRQ
jgi:hypothetical protein